jgi:transcriptional regulator with XRE-family HTH domain
MGRLTEQVRRAIRDSGLSLYALQRLTGVQPSATSRFLRGQRTITLETLDALADVLGLSLVQTVCNGDKKPGQTHRRQRRAKAKG